MRQKGNFKKCGFDDFKAPIGVTVVHLVALFTIIHFQALLQYDGPFYGPAPSKYFFKSSKKLKIGLSSSEFIK